MGYLDNTQVIVDAVLTKRGRELLARNDGSFRITQFALADDEINYSLWNEEHPNGSQFAGEAIENGPLLEAFPDENNIMIHKLVSLPRGTTKLPIVTCNISKIQLSLGATTSVSPNTLNFQGLANVVEQGGYLATIADRRLLQLGLKTNFKVKENPIPWLEWILNAADHTNFFENRVTEYEVAGLTGDWQVAYEDPEAHVNCDHDEGTCVLEDTKKEQAMNQGNLF